MRDPFLIAWIVVVAICPYIGGMTTYAPDIQQCSVCREKVSCDVLQSTNSFGSPDLDLRPPPMQRYTMSSWLQECPQCGYVEKNLSNKTEGAREIIESKAFQSLDQNDEIPPLARRFAKYALFCGQWDEGIAMALLRAAWVCDDSELTEFAKEFRSRAADHFAKLRPFEGEEGVTQGSVLVDVFRRCERFDEAKALASELLLTDIVKANEVLTSVLLFQGKASNDGDTACYTIEDCVPKEEAQEGKK